MQHSYAVTYLLRKAVLLLPVEMSLHVGSQFLGNVYYDLCTD